MVIAKPEWFKRRKYGGWGVVPKTKQGWIYLALVLIPFIILQSIPYISANIKLVITGAWLVFLCVDIFDVMIRMKQDEREKIHEAIAERNALWAIMIVLVVGVGYQVARSTVLQTTSEIDWFLIAALFIGLGVKAISNIYLDKKD
ncbi:MAG: hypothetical protein ACP5OG_00425 [Candidatus Nanoarchaeia archaeon]